MIQEIAARFWRPGYLKALPLILLCFLAACTVPVRAVGPNPTPTPVPFHPAPAPGGIGGGVAAPGPGGPASPTSPAILLVETPTNTPQATPTGTATATPTATPTVLAAAPTPTSVAANTGFVNVAALNVRAGPGTAYPIVATLPGGTPFTVLGQDPTGAWLYVAFSDGTTGWITRILTTYTGQAPAISAPPLPAVVATPTPTPTATPSVGPPTVQLLAPGAGASFVTGSQVTVQWTATDNSGIALAQVQVLVDNAVVLTTAGNGQTSVQSSQQWQAGSVGSHTISVIASDVRGNTSAAASVTIYVTSSSTSPSSFTVYFTQPTGNIVVVSAQGVTVNSTASGPNGINRIELWSDGSLYTTTSNGSPSAVGQAQTFSASQTWSSTVLGQHTIFVRAWDQAGNSVDSGSLTIGVVAGGPPQLSVSFNTTTLNVGQALVVNTTATDSKGVTDIELWVNGAQVAVTTSGSSVGVYQLTASQSWVPASSGQYTVYVLSHDSQGLVAQSPTATVTVLGATATPTSTPATTTPTPETPTPTLTPTPVPPTPTLTPTPVPPTPTPAPTNTPAPTPTPGPPSVSIVRPGDGFTVQLPASIAFAIQARAGGQLARIEVWGEVPGGAGVQLLQSFSVAGRYRSVVGFNYAPTEAGPASFWAIAYDSAGASTQSATVSGTILAALAAVQTPATGPSVSISSPQGGFLDRLPAAVQVTIEAQAPARLARIELWGQDPGASGARLLESFDGNGTAQQTAGTTIGATGAGPASFYALAYDVDGRSARSATVGGMFVAAEPVTVQPTALPTETPAAATPTPPVRPTPPAAIEPQVPPTATPAPPVRLTPPAVIEPQVPAATPTPPARRLPDAVEPWVPLIKALPPPTRAPAPVVVEPQLPPATPTPFVRRLPDAVEPQLPFVQALPPPTSTPTPTRAPAQAIAPPLPPRPSLQGLPAPTPTPTPAMRHPRGVPGSRPRAEGLQAGTAGPLDVAGDTAPQGDAGGVQSALSQGAAAVQELEAQLLARLGQWGRFVGGALAF